MRSPQPSPAVPHPWTRREEKRSDERRRFPTNAHRDTSPGPGAADCAQRREIKGRERHSNEASPAGTERRKESRSSQDPRRAILLPAASCAPLEAAEPPQQQPRALVSVRDLHVVLGEGAGGAVLGHDGAVLRVLVQQAGGGGVEGGGRKVRFFCVCGREGGKFVERCAVSECVLKDGSLTS